MIDDTTAERMVACGWIAASAAGMFMIVLAFMIGFRIGWVYFAGAAMLLALAYGIYRRSRVCAVLVLVNHFLGVAGLFSRAREVPPTVQQARAYVMSRRDVANAHARLLALGHDPQLLGDAPPAAAFATGDDLDHSIRHSP